jgi:hypothetical protein
MRLSIAQIVVVFSAVIMCNRENKINLLCILIFNQGKSISGRRHIISYSILILCVLMIMKVLDSLLEPSLVEGDSL